MESTLYIVTLSHSHNIIMYRVTAHCRKLVNHCSVRALFSFISHMYRAQHPRTLSKRLELVRIMKHKIYIYIPTSLVLI